MARRRRRTRKAAKKPWLSIVVPTLNEEKRIAVTLKHLRDCCPGVEIIVPDGRSEDHTVRIAQEYADKIIVEKKRKSIGAGRNQGARYASAPIILFNDADTLPEKHFFNAMRAAFDDERVAGVGCKIMPREAGFMANAIFEFLNLLVFASVVAGRPSIAGNCVAYRKKAFWAVKGFDEEMEASEDQDLCIRVSRLGEVVYLKDVTAWTSSRRLKKMGWLGLLLDWGKTTANFLLGRKTRRYAIVREV